MTINKWENPTPGSVGPTLKQLFRSEFEKAKIVPPFAETQAPAERIKIDNTVGEPHGALYEYRETDPIIAAGHRAETVSGLLIKENELRTFDFYFKPIEHDAVGGHYVIFWQLHDESGNSPPVCLVWEQGSLSFGSGSGSHIFYEGAMPALGQMHHFRISLLPHLTKGKVKLEVDGEVLCNLENQVTFGIAHLYDKNGILRASASTGTTKLKYGPYTIYSGAEF